MWFRRDLRLADNSAFATAIARGMVLPVYIFDDSKKDDWAPGAASRWWLHQSLLRLDESLGKRLQVFRGDPQQLLPRLAADHGANLVVWNRCYGPGHIEQDQRLTQALQQQGIATQSFNASLLWEPLSVLKQDGTPYKVFSAYYKQALKIPHTTTIDLDSVATEQLLECKQGDSKIDGLGLMPKINWYDNMEKTWQPGESGARQLLDDFLEHGLESYGKGRDFPAQNSVSRLSPHLHFGEISPAQVLARVEAAAAVRGIESQGEHFRRELAWREYSHYLLYHLPTMTDANMNSRFDAFPWRADKALLTAWQRGETGYPLVDAGMRELWQTGYMHNRVRMVVASFLTKNLLQHWLHGARWFWDCLVDADLANNSCSWQWVAGCGADAAPYFRIFNPVTQSQKFDPEGVYIRQYVPELAKLDNRYIHQPWTASGKILADAGVELGNNYPHPTVDLKESRERALQAYESIKN